jgi:hypothetical protein
MDDTEVTWARGLDSNGSGQCSTAHFSEEAGSVLKRIRRSSHRFESACGHKDVLSLLFLLCGRVLLPERVSWQSILLLACDIGCPILSLSRWGEIMYVSVELQPLTGTVSVRQMIIWMYVKKQCYDTERVKTKDSERKLSRCHFMDRPGCASGPLRCETCE